MVRTKRSKGQYGLNTKTFARWGQEPNVTVKIAGDNFMLLVSKLFQVTLAFHPYIVILYGPINDKT